MPAVPRQDRDWWCDVDGTPISLFCEVEQVQDSAGYGVLPSRLHQRGRVVGWGPDSIYVCFDDNQIVNLSPQLLRLLPTHQKMLPTAVPNVCLNGVGPSFGDTV